MSSSPKKSQSNSKKNNSQRTSNAPAGGIRGQQLLDLLHPVGGGHGHAGHDPGLVSLLSEAGDQVSSTSCVRFDLGVGVEFEE